eukprot:gene7343-1310_t
MCITVQATTSHRATALKQGPANKRKKQKKKPCAKKEGRHGSCDSSADDDDHELLELAIAKAEKRRSAEEAFENSIQDVLRSVHCDPETSPCPALDSLSKQGYDISRSEALLAAEAYIEALSLAKTTRNTTAFATLEDARTL